jgi:hypothetical protein
LLAASRRFNLYKIEGEFPSSKWSFSLWKMTISWGFLFSICLREMPRRVGNCNAVAKRIVIGYINKPDGCPERKGNS